MLSYFLLGLFLLLEVGLWLGDIWADFGKIVYGSETLAFEKYIKVQMGILFIYILFRSVIDRAEISLEFRPIKEGLRDIKDNLSCVKAQSLRQEDFYTTFLSSIDRAQHAVEITHLDTMPPGADAVRGSRSQEYFENFSKIIKRYERVEFRRLERLSVEKIDWIEGLMKGLKGRQNFTMAVLDPGTSDRKLPHMSVQIVDAKQVFLVAVAKHLEAHGKRDLLIEDVEMARMWLDYFEQMLWSKATLVVDHGRINQQAWDRLKSSAQVRSAVA